MLLKSSVGPASCVLRRRRSHHRRLRPLRRLLSAASSSSFPRRSVSTCKIGSTCKSTGCTGCTFLNISFHFIHAHFAPAPTSRSSQNKKRPLKRPRDHNEEPNQQPLNHISTSWQLSYGSATVIDSSNGFYIHQYFLRVSKFYASTLTTAGSA